MYQINKQYTASELTNGKYYGIYDQLIALVDSKLEHLTDWVQEMAEQYKHDFPEYSDSQAYESAMHDLKYEIWTAYEDAKHIAIFEGIANKPIFDVYNAYNCIFNEEVK